MRRLALLLVIPALGVTALTFAGGGGEPPSRLYRADFRRTVQVFPGVHVRVLGVDVGTVLDVRNVDGAAQVSFILDRTDVKIPADVKAAVVPSSLLGERYIQLFPAYRGGPQLKPGSTIPLARTAVPSEPDELIRSLQDYLGGLDPTTVSRFVQNAATILDGNGGELNRLIKNAADVMEVISTKREDLSAIVTELNTLTQSLATRQQELAQLIQTYGQVTGIVNDNRASLEGTINGLNEAASQLGSLLTAHEDPLHSDIQTLTRTTRTLTRNVDTLARTGKLGDLILLRLQQRLTEICLDLGVKSCASMEFWRDQVPSLFCRLQCLPGPGGPGPKGSSKARGTFELTDAIESQPGLSAQLSAQAAARGTDLGGLVGSLLEESVGNPLGIGGGL